MGFEDCVKSLNNMT